MKIHDTPASSKFSVAAFLTEKNPFLSSVLMHERELGTVHLLKNFTNNKWYERVFGELPTGQSLTAVFNKYVVSLRLYQQSFFAKKNAARLHKGFLLATFFTFKYTYLCLEDKYLSKFSCSTLIEDSKFFCQFIHDCLQQDYSSSEGQNQEFDLTKDQYQAIIDKVNYLLENYTSVFTNGLDTVYLKQLVRGAAAKYRSSMFRSRLEDMALLQSTSASDDGCDPPDVSLQSVIPESVKANVQSSHKCAGGSEQQSRMKWFIACLCSCSCIKEKSVFDKLEGYNLRMLLQIQYGSHAKIVLPPVLYLMLISICYSNSAFANVDASLRFFSTFVGVVFFGLFGKMYAQSVKPAPAGEKDEDQHEFAEADPSDQSCSQGRQSAANPGGNSDLDMAVYSPTQPTQPTQQEAGLEAGGHLRYKLTTELLKKIYKEYSWSFLGYRSHYRDRFPLNASVDLYFRNIVSQADKARAKGDAGASTQTLNALLARGYVEQSVSGYTLIRSQNPGC